MQRLLLTGLFLSLNFITPFVLILVGVLFRRHPVSDMNKNNGYCTPTSRKSQAHWDYAQKIAPDIYISFGKWLLLVKVVINLVSLFLQSSVDHALMAGFGVDTIVLVYSFFYTDSRIRKECEK